MPDILQQSRKRTHTEAETQAEGEAGSLQGARCGLDSETPESRPEPKANTQPLNHPGAPYLLNYGQIQSKCRILNL